MTKKLAIFVNAFLATMLVGNLGLSQELDLSIPKDNEFQDEHPINLAERSTDSAVSTYAMAVTGKLQNLQTVVPYPRNSAGKRLYGKAIVNIIIDARGLILDAYPSKIADSDDQRTLNDSAIRLVRLAGAFPPPPQQIAKGRKRVFLCKTFLYVPIDKFGQIETP